MLSFLDKNHALKISICLLITVGNVTKGNEAARGENRLPVSLKRAAFPKILKRLRPMPTFHVTKAARKEKQAVFINWRRLYWGKLDGLLYQDAEPEGSDAHGTEGFVDELRHELRAFARDYNLRILWRQTSRTMARGVPEVTGAFLEYWDRGLSREGKAAAQMSLTDLRRLAGQGVGSAKSLGVGGAP